MTSELYIRTELRGGTTVIADCRYTAPLKVAKPFERNGVTEIVIMSATPGMLDGDEYRIRVDVGERCKVRVTTQSYAKIFRSGELGGARQLTELSVADGAELYWQPKPTIPFAGSIANFETHVEASESGKLLLLDTLGCGRSAMGERFMFESYRSRTSVRVGGKLAFLDNCRLVPSEAELGGLGFFEGHDWLSVGYVYGLETPAPPSLAVREFAASDANMGTSFRCLSDSGSLLQL